MEKHKTRGEIQSRAQIWMKQTKAINHMLFERIYQNQQWNKHSFASYCEAAAYNRVIQPTGTWQ